MNEIEGYIAKAICDPLLISIVRRVRLIAFDFDGVFTDNCVYVFEDGREAVRCNRSDGLGLAKLFEMGLKSIVISKETNPVVSARCRKLGLPCIQSCDDKRSELERILEEQGLSLSDAAFMGNDVNDISCLEIVGLPIVVKDAHPDVIPFAKYRTCLKGGYGAVREVCDMFERVRGKENGSVQA